MNRPTQQQLLEYLEGTLDEAERAEILQQIEADPELAAELERAAAGLAALRAISEPTPGRESTGKRPDAPHRVPHSWVVVAAILGTLAVSIPVTWILAGREPESTAPSVEADPATAPEFVLVLRGHWLDDVQLGPEEFQQRISELRAWTESLADSGVLVAATDLAVEQGVRYGAQDAPETERARQAQDPDYVVGVLTLRMDEYHDALAVARSCPHLQYGGSVTVRRVGSGFFTITGRRDFTE